MLEMSFEYWNTLANQIIVISSLLAGFSIAVIANFIVSEVNTTLSKNIMKAAVLAASFFLVSVFSMTKVLMMTTDGFPLKISAGEINTPSLIGGISLLLGIISLITMIAMAGWIKSKKMGMFTSIVGILTLILILIMLA